ncbi:GNAT family N-acetyltransferase [Agarivorans sp. QJM3NY_33]|uniref:GNAT family N-acetyltransferase n=1 Tax=Agarivorans sp. QJM3NY_33 TaxID=3421432 RepID=UPI003D7DAB93
MIVIKAITSEQTLAIRQQVLWPQHDINFCRVAEDQQGLHFGGWLEQKLVIVASLFVSQREVRLRKFACLEQYQNRGFGSTMLRYLIEQQQNQAQSDTFWFDARYTAITFYQNLGFHVDSEVFYKHQIAYVKMSRDLVAARTEEANT